MIINLLKPSFDGFFYFDRQIFSISVNHFVLKLKKIRFVYVINKNRQLASHFKYILFLFLHLFPLYCFSFQENSRLKNAFVNIGIEKGLSSPIVNVLYQDSLGYIWIGTENGLCRYDGYDLIVFKNILGDSSSISSNIITSIVADSKGRLWIGTTNGLNLYNPYNENFIRFFYKYDSPSSIRHNHILKLYPEKTGLLLVETLGGVLTIFDVEGKKTKHFSHLPSSQPYYRYHALYQESDTSIWFGGRGLGLHRINPKNGAIAHFLANQNRQDRKRDDDISLIFKHPSNGFYIAGLDGFYSFTPTDSSFNKLFGTTTYTAVSDSDGNLWVGTGAGVILVKPDQQKFELFSNNPDNPKSIANNNVNTLLIDRNGNLWAGTNQGISFLNLKGDKFKLIQRTKDEFNSLSSNRISSLCEDRSKNLWIGFADAGIDVWNAENELVDRLNLENKKLSSNRVSTIYEDKKGGKWIGLWAGVGFNYVEKNSKKIDHYSFDPNSKRVDWYNSFFEDAYGSFWIGIWGGQGLYKFDNEAMKFMPDQFITNDIPYRDNISEIISTDNSLLFSSVRGNVLYHYFTDSEKFLSFSISDNKSANESKSISKLSNLHYLGENKVVLSSNVGLHIVDLTNYNSNTCILNNVLAIAVSPDYSLIYTITNDKLYKFNKQLKTLSEESLNTFFGNVSSFCVDKKGVVYILTSNNLFAYTPNKTIHRVDTFNWSEAGLTSYNGAVYYVQGSAIYSLEKGLISKKYSVFENSSDENFRIEKLMCENDSSAICFTNKGAYRISFMRGSSDWLDLKVLSDNIDSKINAVAQVNSNQIVLSFTKNIYLVDIKSDSYRMINSIDGKALSSHLITKILGEADGTLWVGTSDEGLNRVSPTRDKIDHFKAGFGANSIAGNHISALFFDRDSNLWIGTDNGISKYSKSTRSVKNFEVTWPSKKIVSIAQDVNNYLWLGTENGLIRFHPQDETYNIYADFNGLTSSNFSHAVLARSDSSMVFGTNNGLLILNPSDFLTNDDDIPVYITSFSVMGKRVKSTFKSPDTIELGYDDSYFSIGVSPLNFSYPVRKSFYYKLEGLDDNWREFNGNMVHFSKLIAGKYKFYVGVNPNINVSNLLTIIVKPPFWQSWWFRLLVVLFVLSITVGYFASYIHQLKIKQRASEFQQKLLLSQMNPHFIFNSLSAIQNYMFANRPIEAGNYLSSFSRLMRLILENSRSKEVLLSKELQALKFYLDLQKLRFSEKFDFVVNTPIGINDDLIYITPMLIQPFIENSIEHGIQHKEGKGYLSVDVEVSDTKVTFTIVDDGVGVKKSREINLARSEFHKSQSTKITQERIDLLSKQSPGNAKIEIIDRQELERVSGTKVIISIPYRIGYTKT